MDNLLRNPNLTSSCLFRAEVLWDSERDPAAQWAGLDVHPSLSRQKQQQQLLLQRLSH